MSASGVPGSPLQLNCECGSIEIPVHMIPSPSGLVVTDGHKVLLWDGEKMKELHPPSYWEQVRRK